MCTFLNQENKTTEYKIKIWTFEAYANKILTENMHRGINTSSLANFHLSESDRKIGSGFNNLTNRLEYLLLINMYRERLECGSVVK